MKGGLSFDGRFGRGVAGLFLYYAPVLYLGIILSVSIHEIVGHGLAALALGGRFLGFGVYFDGMGWASIDVSGLSALRRAIILFAGGAATTGASAALLASAAVSRKRPYAQAVLLLLSFVCLMDGVPYFFWDAIFRSGVGDFSGISRLYPAAALRAWTIGLCGLLMAAGIAAFNFLIWRVSRGILGERFPRGVKAKLALAAPLFAMQAAGWFAFDWNELVPGTGALPGAVALGLTLAALIALVASRSPAGDGEEAEAPEEPSARRMRCASGTGGPPRGDRLPLKPAILAWIAAAAVAIAALFWSGKGVLF